MGVSKKQGHIAKICACGCESVFNAFPIYTNKRIKHDPDSYDSFKGDRGATLYTSKYRRGHHPNMERNQFGSLPAWNKGLKKGDHLSIDRMGFQKGHRPFNDWSKVIEMQRNDPEHRKKWIASKKGQVAWSKGLKKPQYKNGFKSGKDHGNWCGGTPSVRDSTEYKDLMKAIKKRDNYTCQYCGDRGYKGREVSVRLETHHIIGFSENHDLILEPSNLITLCHKCHVATDNYGSKNIGKRRKNKSR